MSDSLHSNLSSSHSITNFTEQTPEDGENGGGIFSCCGGGNMVVKSSSRMESSQVSDTYDNMGSEQELEGQGCCGGGKAVDISIEDSAPVSSDTTSGDTEVSIAQEGGCCSCKGRDQTQDDLDADNGSMASIVSRDEEGGEGGAANDDISASPAPLTVEVTPAPSAPIPEAPSSTPKVTTTYVTTPESPPKADAENEEEPDELVLSDGIYCAFDGLAKGRLFLQFAKRGYPDGLFWGRLTAESKIPAFKFKGTGQTDIVSKIHGNRLMFYQGVCTYLKSVMLYNCEVVLFNRECPMDFEVYFYANELA